MQQSYNKGVIQISIGTNMKNNLKQTTEFRILLALNKTRETSFISQFKHLKGWVHSFVG